jgi:hypothetical protein
MLARYNPSGRRVIAVEDLAHGPHARASQMIHERLEKSPHGVSVFVDPQVGLSNGPMNQPQTVP